MAKASVDFKAALERSAIDLIDSTPSREEMEGYTSEIKNKFLKGLKLPIDIDVRDSEQFAQQVMANTAASLNIKATAKDIQQWATVPINELSTKVGVNLDELANGTMMATAQAGLETAGKAYGESFQLFSLTDSVLTDSNLDVMEAVQLGATAVSMASTLISSAAGGAALGPYGAVAGVILGAVSYFTSSAEQAKQAEAQAMERVYSQMAAEKQKLDTYNLQEQERYKERLDVLWDAKDSAVALVADSWAAYEQELGVRFGLRFFPNSPPPVRGGLKRMGDLGINRPVMCTSPGGCPYFPEPTPARVKALGYEKAMLELVDALAAKGTYLFNPSKAIETQYIAQPQGFSAYYDRTLRAYSSFIREGNFWEPKNVRNTNVKMKNYTNHLQDVFTYVGFPTYRTETYYETGKTGPQGVNCFVIPGKPAASSGTKVSNNVMFSKGKYIYPASDIEKKFAEWQVNFKCATIRKQSNGTMKTIDAVGVRTIQGVKAKIYEFAEDYWLDLNEALEKEQNASNVFKTRISGDLIQTANAVGGELATSLRLQSIMSETGTRSIQELTKNNASLKALPSETLARVQKATQRDGLINNGMLALGVGALGYGAKRKWG